MKTRIVIALAAAALGAYACSSGGDASDGGTDATMDTTTSDAGSDVVTTDGGDAAKACASPVVSPTSIDGGLFCPYQDSGAPACTGFMQQCCIPGTGGSSCSMMPCGVSGIGVQCAETNDCMMGMVCCLSGLNDIHQDPGCPGYYAVTSAPGTMCGPMCPPGAMAQVCGSDSDCTGGKTCKPLLLENYTRPIWLGGCIAADGGF